MRGLRIIFWSLLVTGMLLVAGALFGPRYLSTYQTDGGAYLPGLKSDVTVTRDEKGMAYIRADALLDAIQAQGFVTAQDRLFQMQVTRLLAQGRLSELAGETAKSLDVMHRTIGLHRLARRHAEILEPESRAVFQRYVDGVNAFIENHPGDVHLEFKFAAITPETWTVVDSLSVLYYLGWITSANIQTEIITQMLVEKLGWEKAREIFPLNLNPDDLSEGQATASKRPIARLSLEQDETLIALARQKAHGLGSNNWAVSPRLSPGDKPILAGDPHLDARVLPGVWYPLAIVTPQIRTVGVNLAGLPGMAIGRTTHIAIAATNAYGDVQDLYVETVDPDNPDHYLEARISKPFGVVNETLRIRDGEAPGGFREEQIQVRHTTRGPVVSGVLSGLETDKVLTLRWAAAESMQPNLAVKDLLTARTVEDVHKAVAGFSMFIFNWVFADTEGSIEWRVGGKIPIRVRGDGTVPLVVEDGSEDWAGWIPFETMPHVSNPARGWLGTANHKTVGNDYPYYYSSYFAPSYRYRRLTQLLEAPGEKSVDDHWSFQHDTKNLMVQEIAPIMANALLGHADTEPMGRILEEWDFLDHAECPAPTIFQTTYRKFAEMVFRDELGPELTQTMLASWYFWQERLQKMVKDGDSEWFDIVDTEGKKETRDDLFHLAALKAARELEQQLGGRPREWGWGKVHKIDFVNPLRRRGWGKSLLGGRTYSMSGSGETLHRGFYDFHNPAWVIHSASLRMVVDLNDPEKVRAILPGGVTGRTFHPHFTDQLDTFMSGGKLFWWFSDQAIEQHEVSRLVLREP